MAKKMIMSGIPVRAGLVVPPNDADAAFFGFVCNAYAKQSKRPMCPPAPGWGCVLEGTRNFIKVSLSSIHARVVRRTQTSLIGGGGGGEEGSVEFVALEENPFESKDDVMESDHDWRCCCCCCCF